MAQELATIWRVFSVEDGTTSREQLEVPLHEDRAGRTSKLLAGPGVMLRRSAPGRAATWHTAPRRQMIATLGGWAEIETGDGQRLRLTPDVLVVVEDVAGVGHQTWTDPVDGWQMLFIPLDDATVLV